MKAFDYYRAGQINGAGAVLWIFRFYRPDGSFGSCQCVEESAVAANRDALVAMGWQARVCEVTP